MALFSFKRYITKRNKKTPDYKIEGFLFKSYLVILTVYLIPLFVVFILQA